VSAYLWFNLAAAAGNSDAELLLKEVAARMSGTQLAAAQNLTRDWKAKGADVPVTSDVDFAASVAGFNVQEVYFRPAPAHRGEEAWMGVHYALAGGSGAIQERWTLLCDGKELFAPVELRYDPDAKAGAREVPLPIPAGAAPGDYTLRLRATRNGAWIQREFRFRVE